MAVKKNKVIKKAKEELEYLTGDEETKRIAELRDKGIRDYNSGIAYAKEQGIKEGIEQGIEQGMQAGEQKNKIKVAKEMLKKGFNINIISEITKLSIKEIKKL